MNIWRVIRGFPLFIAGLYASAVRSSESKAGAELRRWLYKTSCHLDTGVHVTKRANFRSGHGSALYHGTYVLNGHGQFALGNRSHLGAFCFVNVEHGSVTIGDDVAIGPGTKLVAYSNYYRRGTKITEERITKDIRIGNNVFIGANCTVLPGVVVEDNVIVGANSVVRGRLATNAIYAGAPCREIRRGWYQELSGGGL